jgi:hypothetical protein
MKYYIYQYSHNRRKQRKYGIITAVAQRIDEREMCGMDKCNKSVQVCQGRARDEEGRKKERGGEPEILK